MIPRTVIEGDKKDQTMLAVFWECTHKINVGAIFCRQKITQKPTFVTCNFLRSLDNSLLLCTVGLKKLLKILLPALDQLRNIRNPDSLHINILLYVAYYVNWS